MMGQRCQTFMTSLVSYNEEPIDLVSIPLISKFFDVFPKILLGIPAPREVEFTIDIALSM